MVWNVTQTVRINSPNNIHPVTIHKKILAAIKRLNKYRVFDHHLQSQYG